MLRCGLRDLHSLTYGLDHNSASIIETLLNLISFIDRKEQSESLSNSVSTIASSESIGDSSDGNHIPPLLVRQFSTDARFRIILRELRDSITAADYRYLVETFLKIVRSIRETPFIVRHRRLQKDNPSIMILLAMSPLVMDLFTFIGFQERTASILEGPNSCGVLEMRTVQNDLIIRSLSILDSECSELSIDV
jgi:hypothetical protein